MVLVILYRLNAKLSIRRDGTARADAGGSSVGGRGNKGIFLGRRTRGSSSGIRAPSRGRLMLRTYAVSEAAAAAAAEAKSSGGGIDPADGSTDLVVR